MNTVNKDRKRPSKHYNAKRKNNPNNNQPTNTNRPANNPRPIRGKSKKSEKTIDLSLLVKTAKLKEEVKYQAKRTFAEFPLHTSLLNKVKDKGYINPTEIQDKTIEQILDHKNLLGIAQTGTGKTAAFLLPIINQLIDSRRNNHALIVVPTRELALQVDEEFKSLTKGLNLFSNCFIGGININRDKQALRRPTHITIGTPGRILDLMQQRLLDLRQVNTLVLDEFDRMLDMGFINDVKKVLAAMRNRRQTLLFSATLDKSQQNLIDDILVRYDTVKVSTGNTSTENVEQSIVKLEKNDIKFEVLLDLLYNKEFDRVILFEETKHKVKRLCAQLNKAGFKAEEIHGNKSQNARQTALDMFKKGKSNILVATDVAARGIDIDDVSHVINYQVPGSYDTYIHRIGRTGRAGKIGKAITLVDNDKWQKDRRAV